MVVAAGIRRIEAVTGKEAYKLVNEKKELLKDISNKLKMFRKRYF